MRRTAVPRLGILLSGLVGTLSLAVALPAAGQATTSGTSADTAGGPCDRIQRIAVPGAERQEKACLDDLTTAGTVASGHTNPDDWSGLHAAGTQNPSGVPGIQIDGYFPDDSTTNTNHGWNHDSQFVVRLPETWNGRLVITGAPGVRRQYANDFIFSDWLLAQGYAFASTDKGNTGTAFYRDGSSPGGSIREWHRRVTQLTWAAQSVVAQRYGVRPRRTYMAGISNGGYLTRWQLENNPQLFDGGLDWEGTLFRAAGPNLLTFLPPALRHYPEYAATGSEQAHDAIIRAGFAPGSEFLWDHHYGYYWDLTQRIYREELDPRYDGTTDAGVPFCQDGTSVPGCDADYRYRDRPQAVHDAVRSIQLTGRIRRPLITVHGTLDTLLPPKVSSVAYTRLVDGHGLDGRHRSYLVEDGNHVDSLYTTFPDRLRPLLPCARAGFTAMVRWVERGVAPPREGFVPRPAQGDLVNSCRL